MTQDNKFSGFYKLSIEERREIAQAWMEEDGHFIWDQMGLKSEVANQLIENYIINYELPLGLAVNFKVNDVGYIVPMAVEEPSVVAAASNGAKILGNITAKTSSREITGQIVFKTSQKFDIIQDIVLGNKEKLMSVAKEASDSMVRRGGGPSELWLEEFEKEGRSFIAVYLSFDPCDAMGANALNTVLEAMTPLIEEMISEPAIMSILSNYQPHSVTKAEVSLEVNKLHSDIEMAREIAHKIADASLFASLDPYRAATHNKGIMNGVDAVVVATGNDWRAVEASVHAYAVKEGQYRALSSWSVSSDEKFLKGTIELPLQIATVGGTLSSHPQAAWALKLLNIKSAEELSNIMAAVGLAQNFAAIRALVTDGIQKGHMRMQARALAMQVGAEVSEVEAVVQKLIKQDRMNQASAREVLQRIRNEDKGD